MQQSADVNGGTPFAGARGYAPPLLYHEDIQAMEQRAQHFLKTGTRNERRLSKNLMTLIAWARAEHDHRVTPRWPIGA